MSIIPFVLYTVSAFWGLIGLAMLASDDVKDRHTLSVLQLTALFAIAAGVA